MYLIILTGAPRPRVEDNLKTRPPSAPVYKFEFHRGGEHLSARAASSWYCPTCQCVGLLARGVDFNKFLQNTRPRDLLLYGITVAGTDESHTHAKGIFESDPKKLCCGDLSLDWLGEISNATIRCLFGR